MLSLLGFGGFNLLTGRKASLCLMKVDNFHNKNQVGAFAILKDTEQSQKLNAAFKQKLEKLEPLRRCKDTHTLMLPDGHSLETRLIPLGNGNVYIYTLLFDSAVQI